MRAWGLTDRGMVRHENQDAFAIRRLSDSSLLAVVCDGMGGARSGNVASLLALETFTEEVLRGYKESLKAAKCEKLLLSAAEKANAAVYEQALHDADYEGMGTTLVAAVVRDDTACVLNVGDSRCYLISGKKVRQVSEDHSLVEELVRMGRLKEEEARVHPNRNIITRAVGIDPIVETDVLTADKQPGDRWLICSDGLYNMVEDEEISRILTDMDDEKASARLMELALENGGTDNISFVICRIEEAEA